MPQTIIHWFRRDLRLDDNSALIAACTEAARLVPLFILDELLLQSERAAGPRISFMLHCLRHLDEQLRARGSALLIRRGQPAAVLRELAGEVGAAAVYCNRDYSPYAQKRDAAVEAALAAEGLRLRPYADQVLHEAEEILTEGGSHYQVFSPYFRKWRALPKPMPQPFPGRMPPLPEGLALGSLPSAAALGGCTLPEPITQPGEAYAQQELQQFLEKRLASYDQQRDFLAAGGTSRLSPHLRWGTLSIRRCFQGADQPQYGEGGRVWRSELAWRDFYQMILRFNPQVLHQNYKTKYDALIWAQNPAAFEAWKAGRTGYPVVDAAMRQLSAQGWMHNRARMIVASFFCKDLLLDWRQGERYFMQGLLDGDSAANNGGWQWAAGTGTDAAPYFRIFNPISQGQKFDPAGDYVRRWLPELATVPAKYIHQPWKLPAVDRAALNYPAPIVEHQQQRRKALAMFEALQ